MQHCFVLSRKSLRFLGSAMGIAIANRKSRCDFGVLRDCRTGVQSPSVQKLYLPLCERAKRLEKSMTRKSTAIQKTGEGCGCPKFPTGNVFRQISTLLENDSPIFRQRDPCQGLGTFRKETAAGKLAAPAGTLLDFLL